MTLAEEAAETARATAGKDASVDLLKDAFCFAAWKFYYAHEREVAFKRKVFGLWTVTILYRDLRPVFVVLFGEE